LEIKNSFRIQDDYA